MWCIQEITVEYRKRMYDILKLYNQPYNPLMPVIGLDEKPKQLIGDSRMPIPMKSGKAERYDYEYVRHGTANIFVAVEPRGGRRVVQVTGRRAKIDFAKFMEILVNKYQAARKLRIVLDNLNTHNKESIVDAFGIKRAEKILRKVEFHYTPKHASWLNVAEIEIGVMDTECTDRRIPNKKSLSLEVKSWAARRNKQGKKINWRFTREDADKKLGKHYVS